jgi:hypothetical protein
MPEYRNDKNKAVHKKKQDPDTKQHTNQIKMKKKHAEDLST